MTGLEGKIDPAHVGCEAMPPIGWSIYDTDATIRAVKEHNAVWTALCKS